MLTQQKLIISLALALSPAGAGPLLYVVTFTGQFGAPNAGQFGTVDPTTGAYRQIGPSFADPFGGLVQGGPTGYLGVSFSFAMLGIGMAAGLISRSRKR
jgi:hypothetical protein